METHTECITLYPALPFETYGDEPQEPGECFACGCQMVDEDAGWEVCIDCLYDGCADDDFVISKFKEQEEILAQDYPVAGNLEIDWKIVKQISAWAGMKHPEEVGGIVWSYNGVPSDVSFLRNVQTYKGGLYSPDPVEFIKQVNIMEKRGFKIEGWWHSHPHIPARPSLTDLEHHKHPFKMFIFSVKDQELKAYNWSKENPDQLEEYHIEVM